MYNTNINRKEIMARIEDAKLVKILGKLTEFILNKQYITEI